MLQPNTSCREVVRHVQALCRLNGWAPVAEGDSAYVQARLPSANGGARLRQPPTVSAAESRAERTCKYQEPVYDFLFLGNTQEKRPFSAFRSFRGLKIW